MPSGNGAKGSCFSDRCKVTAASIKGSTVHGLGQWGKIITDACTHTFHPEICTLLIGQYLNNILIYVCYNLALSILHSFFSEDAAVAKQLNFQTCQPSTLK